MDHGFSRWVVDHRTPPLDHLFVWLTRIGTFAAVWVAIALVLALLRRRLAIVLAVVAAVYAADLCAYGLKLAIGRPRPDLRPLVRLPTDGSFPSGHTSTSFAGAAVVACFAPRLAPLLYLLAAAIGFSRIYVGVHWPLDVLGGAVLGTAVALLVLTSLRLLERSRRRSRAAPPPG